MRQTERSGQTYKYFLIMIGLYQTVKNDLFGIARRLKAIDKDYFVVYSYRKDRYEVHNKGNKGNTFCFSAASLDERVITKARQTRRERVKELFFQIERDNDRAIKAALSDTSNKIQMNFEKVLSKGGKL